MCAPRQHAGDDVSEWENLVMEFEKRSTDSRNRSSLKGSGAASGNESQDLEKPPPGELGRLNPEIYEKVLPITESAMMAAITSVMWILARFVRLDNLFTLFYPLPSLFIAMRWGAYFGNITTIATVILPFAYQGPLFGVLYLLDTGFLTFAFVNALWYRWHWIFVLLLGMLVKALGLMLNITWTSALIRVNSWQIIISNVESLLNNVGNLVFKLLGRKAFTGLTQDQVHRGLCVVLGVHTFIHVSCLHMTSTMLLDRLYDAGLLKKPPRLLPFLGWLKARIRKYDYSRRTPFYKSRKG